VSTLLHRWVDLVFGAQQRGRAAVAADNAFQYFTYEGAAAVGAIEDPTERRSLETRILNCGQVPPQLFDAPHPRRLTAAEAARARWSAAMASALLSVRHSGARRVIITTPHADPIVAMLLPRGRAAVITVDAAGAYAEHRFAADTPDSAGLPFTLRPASSLPAAASPWARLLPHAAAVRTLYEQVGAVAGPAWTSGIVLCPRVRAAGAAGAGVTGGAAGGKVALVASEVWGDGIERPWVWESGAAPSALGPGALTLLGDDGSVVRAGAPDGGLEVAILPDSPVGALAGEHAPWAARQRIAWHAAPVTCVDATEDGTVVVSAAADGGVAVWHVGALAGGVETGRGTAAAAGASFGALGVAALAAASSRRGLWALGGDVRAAAAVGLPSAAHWASASGEEEEGVLWGGAVAGPAGADRAAGPALDAWATGGVLVRALRLGGGGGPASGGGGGGGIAGESRLGDRALSSTATAWSASAAALATAAASAAATATELLAQTPRAGEGPSLHAPEVLGAGLSLGLGASEAARAAACGENMLLSASAMLEMALRSDTRVGGGGGDDDHDHDSPTTDSGPTRVRVPGAASISLASLAVAGAGWAAAAVGVLPWTAAAGADALLGSASSTATSGDARDDSAALAEHCAALARRALRPLRDDTGDSGAGAGAAPPPLGSVSAPAALSSVSVPTATSGGPVGASPPPPPPPPATGGLGQSIMRLFAGGAVTGGGPSLDSAGESGPGAGADEAGAAAAMVTGVASMAATQEATGLAPVPVVVSPLERCGALAAMAAAVVVGAASAIPASARLAAAAGATSGGGPEAAASVFEAAPAISLLASRREGTAAGAMAAVASSSASSSSMATAAAAAAALGGEGGGEAALVGVPVYVAVPPPLALHVAAAAAAAAATTGVDDVGVQDTGVLLCADLLTTVAGAPSLTGGARAPVTGATALPARVAQALRPLDLAPIEGAPSGHVTMSAPLGLLPHASFALHGGRGRGTGAARTLAATRPGPGRARGLTEPHGGLRGAPRGELCCAVQPGANADAPFLTLLGHTAPVTALSASAALGVVVSGDALGVVLVHSLRTGSLLRALPLGADGGLAGGLAGLRTFPAWGRPVAGVRLAASGLVALWSGKSVCTATVNGAILAAVDCADPVRAVLPVAGGRLVVLCTARDVSARWAHNLAVYSVLDKAPVAEHVAAVVTRDERTVLVALANGALAAYAVPWART
jgi:hypothetical protein